MTYDVADIVSSIKPRDTDYPGIFWVWPTGVHYVICRHRQQNVSEELFDTRDKKLAHEVLLALRARAELLRTFK